MTMTATQTRAHTELLGVSDDLVLGGSGLLHHVVLNLADSNTAETREDGGRE